MVIDMSVPKKTKSPRRADYSVVVERVYRWLPLLFVVMSVLNVWFLYAYVKSERERVSLDKEAMLSNVSNVYSFVMSSLSNEIRRVRLSNDMRSRPFVRSLGNSTNELLTATSFVSVTNDSFVSDVPLLPSPRGFDNVDGWYSVVGGFPCVVFDDTPRPYYVGDDFGLGEIESISRLFVSCGGSRYRLARPVRAPYANKYVSSFSVSEKSPLNRTFASDLNFNHND